MVIDCIFTANLPNFEAHLPNFEAHLPYLFFEEKGFVSLNS